MFAGVILEVKSNCKVGTRWVRQKCLHVKPFQGKNQIFKVVVEVKKKSQNPKNPKI